MITNPNTGGRNFPLGIPKVYAGQTVSPSKFNNLSSAIQRNSIVTVNGASVSRTSTGTSVTIPNARYGLQPFETMTMKDSVIVFNGNIWTNKNYNADAKQIIPSDDGTPQLPKGDYTCSISGKSEMENPFALVFPIAGGNKLVWFDTTPEDKPELKYTAVSDYEESQGGVAIAFISEAKIVYQINIGNIWLRDAGNDLSNIHPFKIIANYEDGKDGNAGSVKFRVNYGTINNMVPQYENGKSISDKTVKLSMSASPTYVWLRLEGGAYPSAFPVKAVIVASANGGETDTIGEEGGYAWIKIGSITSASGTKSYSVDQAITNSLRGECHRLRTFGAYDTFFYAV